MKNLSDDTLLLATETHAREERKSGVQVLWHLREIERRMLYSKLWYGSLFAYAVKHLQYSEGAAQRRIDAMRMLKEIPELEGSLESGELTLTNLSLVKQATKDSKKTISEKRALLEEVKGKSKRECEKILARELPQSIPSEKERVLTETHTEVRVVLNEGQLGKLNRLKALLSHKNPNPTYAELIEMLSDLALKELDPMEWKPKKKTSKTTPPVEHLNSSRIFSGKAVPSRLRRETWKKTQGNCSRCGSTHLLEIDHKIPRAKGGPNEATNLRMLCRSCNQFEAMRVFGPKLMRKYLPRLRD